MYSILNKFKDVCPRKLTELPCEACPIALERMNAIRYDTLEKKKPETEPECGCPWFVSSAEHNYCFWVYNKTLEDDPAGDREICDLLMINKATLEKIFESAINKLFAIKDSDIIRELSESVAEASVHDSIDYTTYMPSEFREVIDKTANKEVDEDQPIKEKPKAKAKHPTGLPLHRDGKKVDLFGLYSKKNPPKREKKNEQKNDKK